MFLFSLQAQHFSGILFWVHKDIVPAVFVGPWYNEMPPADSENGLLIDRNSVLVGMARLRQLRVLNGKKGGRILKSGRAFAESEHILGPLQVAPNQGSGKENKANLPISKV